MHMLCSGRKGRRLPDRSRSETDPRLALPLLALTAMLLTSSNASRYATSSTWATLLPCFVHTIGEEGC